MGDGGYRRAVTKSVNALAGKEIITHMDMQNLGNPETWPKALPEVIGKVRSAWSDAPAPLLH